MMSNRPAIDVSNDIASDWADGFLGLRERAGRCFRRCDIRARAAGYVRGLLGRIERKNGWQMSEYLGAASPYAVQHLLGRSNWNAGTVRDEIFRYSSEHLITPIPDDCFRAMRKGRLGRQGRPFPIPTDFHNAGIRGLNARAAEPSLNPS